MISVTYPAQIGYLREASSVLADYLHQFDISERVIGQLNVAMEEIFVNISSYAYPDSEGPITIELDCQDGTVIMRIIDGGVPFDPLKKPDPDTSLSVEDRPIGGLGIYMVKKTMDKVGYEYKDGKNILTLTKSV